jgi:hypothetical protein
MNLSNTVRVIKWGRIKWASHVASNGGRSRAYTILVDKPEGRRTLGSFGVDGRVWAGLIWLSISGALPWASYEPSVSIFKKRRISWHYWGTLSFSIRILLPGVNWLVSYDPVHINVNCLCNSCLYCRQTRKYPRILRNILIWRTLAQHVTAMWKFRGTSFGRVSIPHSQWLFLCDNMNTTKSSQP